MYDYGVTDVNKDAVRYMIDRNGRVTYAVVPIELWQEVSGDDPLRSRK